MKVDTPRDLALKVLNDLSSKPGFSATALDNLFRSRAYLEERDRAFVSQLVQGSVRWRARLDWTIAQTSDVSLKKISPPVLNLLRLALYQILFLDRVPESAAVNEAVKQAKKKHPPYIASFVNAVLRKVCRNKNQISFPDRDKTRWNTCPRLILIRNGWCGNGSGSGEWILQKPFSNHRTASQRSPFDPTRSRSIEKSSSDGLKEKTALWGNQPFILLRESN